MTRKSIAAFIILIVFTLFFLISGAAALLKNGSVPINSADKGDVCEFTAVYAFEVLELKHSVNLIPTGSDHYYLMMTNDNSAAPFLVRAKPSYIEKNFSGGIAMLGSQKIKGRVTRLNYKATSEVSLINSKLLAENIITSGEKLNTYYYIDMRFKEFGGLRILCGIGFAALVTVGFIGGRSGVLGKGGNKLLGGIFLILTLGLLALVLYTLSMSGI